MSSEFHGSDSYRRITCGRQVSVMGSRKSVSKRRVHVAKRKDRVPQTRRRATGILASTAGDLDLSSVARHPAPGHVAPTVKPGPDPLFECGQFISTPLSVCENRSAYIVGYEWGPNSNKRIGPGWVYWLVEVPKGGFPIINARPWISGRRFRATEEEMVQWTEASK